MAVVNLDLSRASQEMAWNLSTDLRLFHCPSCGGVWWAVYAPICLGPEDSHMRKRMRRADTVSCGNTPGLVVEL